MKNVEETKFQVAMEPQACTLQALDGELLKIRAMLTGLSMLFQLSNGADIKQIGGHGPLLDGIGEVLSMISDKGNELSEDIQRMKEEARP